jgi:uncharacterized phage protein gp47/JayE
MTVNQTRFETTAAGVLTAGALWTDVPAQAVEPGTAGNVSAGSILTMAVAPVGISRCANPDPFSGGSGEETDERLRERILDSFQRLPNGANSAYYEQEAMRFEQVAAVEVLPRKRGIGTVDVVVATLSGTPEEALLDQLRTHFAQSREIAVDVAVSGPETVSVDVAVQVSCDSGQEEEQVLAQVRDTITGWFDGRRLGKNVLLAQLNSLVFAVEGVANCAVTSPAADVAVERGQLPVLGTLTVEAMA